MNKNEKKKIIRCVICGNEVLVDDFNQGTCTYCSWEQSKISIDYPNKVCFPNRISYYTAKSLLNENKPLVPSFEDFVDMFLFYGEIELKYKNRWFGLTASNGKILEFFEANKPGLQMFNSVQEFANNASIDGQLLKNIWSDVEQAIYMECGEPRNK